MPVLAVNLGEKGGCVYYANSLLAKMTIPMDVWLHPNSEGSDNISHSTIRTANMRLRFFIFVSPFVMMWYFLYLTFCIAIKKYDRVVVFGPHIMDFMILLPFRIWGKRTVYVVHDGVMHNGDAPVAYQVEIKWCLRIATELVFLSNYTRDLVHKELGIRKPGIIIPHGVVTYADTVETNRTLNDSIKLLLIGRITYYKGIDIVFDFLRKDAMFDGTITVAGKFSSDIEIPEECNCDDRIRIIDKWLTGDEIDALIKDSNILLMPYHEATQSGVAAMAIGYGIPVIATKVGALEEQLESSAFYMRSDDWKSLSDVISSVSSRTYDEKKKEINRLSDRLQWAALANELQNYLL